MERVVLRATEAQIIAFMARRGLQNSTVYSTISKANMPVELKIEKLKHNLDLEILEFKEFILTIEDLEERYWQYSMSAHEAGDIACYAAYTCACERLRHKIHSFYDYVAKNGIVV